MTEITDTGVYTDTEVYTTSLVETLTRQTATALDAVGTARRALNTLTGFQVYAIEFAETDLGLDAQAELDTAARALRGLRRILDEYTARNTDTHQDDAQDDAANGAQEAR